MSDLGDFASFEPDDDEGDDSPDADDEPGSEGRAGPGTDAETGPGPGTGGGAGDGTVDGFETEPAEPRGSDHGIGTLSAAEGLSVGEREDDTRLRAYVTVGNRASVRVGTYLVAPYPGAAGAPPEAGGERLFARVVALEYAQEFHADDATEIHARRAMRSEGIDEQDYKFIATLEPIAILTPGGGSGSGSPFGGDGDAGGLTRRMPDRVPQPETVVRRATDRQEVKTGLKLPEEGAFVGHLAVGGETVRTAAEPPTVDYRLSDDGAGGADPLIFRHALVAGGTGSGKTHATKNLLRQYLGREYGMADGRTPGLAVVQFDPQDEYAQMHDDNPAIDGDVARRLAREGISHGGHDDTLAFVPVVGGADYAADHHRAEQVPFTVPFSMVRDRPWLVAGAGLNDNQYPALQRLLGRFFRQHGDGGTYEQFRTFLDDPGLREELHESGRIHEATFDAVKRRTYGFGDVFDRAAEPITDLVHRFVRPGGLSTVPTYHVNDSRTTTTVVLAVASLLIDQKLSNDPEFDRIKETPLVVGMDEAHSFLADAEDVQARKVIGKFSEAAKQGRKERLGLFLVTQDPQDVADPIFKQVNTTVALNLSDEDALSAVNLPTELEAKVPYFEKGQMAVYSPDNSEPVEVSGLPVCVTRHGRE